MTTLQVFGTCEMAAMNEFLGNRDLNNSTGSASLALGAMIWRRCSGFSWLCDAWKSGWRGVRSSLACSKFE